MNSDFPVTRACISRLDVENPSPCRYSKSSRLLGLPPGTPQTKSENKIRL